MDAKEIERAAYRAAHRIWMATAAPAVWACPGTRRSHMIDTIADIIRDEFEERQAMVAENSTERTVQISMRIAGKGPAGSLVTLPRRAS